MSTDQITAKQVDFIRSLVEQHDVASLTDEQRAFLASDRLTTITRGAASRIIDQLKALPVKPGQAHVAGGEPDVPEGRYAVELGGTLRFFKVDRPDEGRWAGRLFLAEVIGGESRGRSIRERGEKSLVLNALHADADGARARYGRTIGKCGCCNRTLTDETSRLSGIGPDCAKQHGIDREAIIASLPADDDAVCGYSEHNLECTLRAGHGGQHRSKQSAWFGPLERPLSDADLENGPSADAARDDFEAFMLAARAENLARINA
jgi:Family of unknown function (DUF6011)